MLSEFSHLTRWEENVRALGHGTSTDLAPEQALSIALAAESVATSGVADHDPQGLTVGASVSVGPDVASGEQFVEGRVRYADAETIVIERSAEEVGNVCVHFPRAGYRVEV